MRSAWYGTILLAHGADIEATSESSKQPLHLAIEHKNNAVAKHLLESGANIEAKTYYLKERPLHLAIAHNNDTIAKELLERGANIEARSNGFTPLHIAVKHEALSLVKLLVYCNADINARTQGSFHTGPGKTSLHLAVLTGNVELLQILLDGGASVDTLDDGGNTPLSYAIIKECSLNILEILSNRVANIESEYKKGWNPLRIAIARRNIDALELLLKHKSTKTLNSEDAKLALETYYSPEPEHGPYVVKVSQEVAECVIDHCSLTDSDYQKILNNKYVELNSQTVQKLASAVSEGSVSSLIATLKRSRKEWVQFDHGIEVLLKKLDDIAPSDLQRISVAALELNDPATTALLVQRNILSLKTLKGKNLRRLLFFAAQDGNLSLTNLLLNALVPVDERCRDGRTALSYALGHGMLITDEEKPVLTKECKEEYDEIIKVLLQKGADPDLRSWLGKTPMDWANTAGNTTAKALVEEYGITLPHNLAQGGLHQRKAWLDVTSKSKQKQRLASLSRTPR